MKVDMNLLKQLREETQAPFKDCKEALVEAEGNKEEAQKILREKGAAKAAKKSERETNEGIVKVRQKNDNVYIVKLGCETDFVAKNEQFHELAEKILDEVESNVDSHKESVQEVSEEFIENNVNPILQEYVAKIGENLRLLDLFVSSGNAFVYTHPGDRVSSVIFYNCEGDGCEDIAKDVALQVAAMDPTYRSVEDVPESTKAEMKDSYKKEMEGSGKPEDIIEKIVEGKINKSYSDFVLLEQPYIRDDSQKIKNITGDNFEILSYRRFSI